MKPTAAPVVAWQDKQYILFALEGALLDSASEHYFWYELLPLVYATTKQLSVVQAKMLLESELSFACDTLNLYFLDYCDSNNKLICEPDLELTQIKNFAELLPLSLSSWI